MYATQKVDFDQPIKDTPLAELVDEVINRLRLSNGIEFCTLDQIECLQGMLAGMADDVGIAFK